MNTDLIHNYFYAKSTNEIKTAKSSNDDENEERLNEKG